ncbi:MAG: hypothetical protein KAW13_00400 [Dehalococcoidia bacterium]|nr:hypothetical protein [Dehalococcoidia bacterium]
MGRHVTVRLLRSARNDGGLSPIYPNEINNVLVHMISAQHFYATPIYRGRV